MSKKKTVAIFTAPEGHQSIAEAVIEALQNNYKIKTLIHRDPLFNAYVPIYQYLPGVFKIPFKISTHQKGLSSISKFLRFSQQKMVTQFYQKHQPDLLISVHWMYSSSLERLQNVTRVPFINILTDPLTIHPLLVSPQAKTNLVFDNKTKKVCLKINPQAKYQTTGWFVRDRFEAAYDQKKVRKKLKLAPDKLTFLIASGSEGTNLVLKVLPTLLFTSQPIQVIVACGNNKTLYKSVRALQKLLKKTGRSNILIPLKFTPNIHRYMQAADLVIGKAGPNMLFESIATETPFFAITHISGQEDGNLDIIREYHLGYVEENMIKAQKLLKNILNQPEQLKKIKKDIIKLKKYNQQSKEKLQEMVAQLI